MVQIHPGPPNIQTDNICYNIAMIAFDNDNDSLEEESAEKDGLKKSVYPMDRHLIEQTMRMYQLLRNEAIDRVKGRCKAEGKPFINPQYYYPIFVEGWTRTSESTADSVIEQCMRSGEPENKIVAFSIYKNLLDEYENKILALGKILMRRNEGNFELPIVDEDHLKDAENSLDAFRQQHPLEQIAQCSNADEQRTLLRQWVEDLRKEVWAKIEKAAIYVRNAGNAVMKIVYESLDGNVE